MLHNETSIADEKSLKRLEIEFCFIDMGASEQAIAEKVARQFRKKYPHLLITVTSHFYASETSLQAIEDSKNKKPSNYKFSEQKLNSAKANLIQLRNLYLENGMEDYEGFYKELTKLSRNRLNQMFYRKIKYLDKDVTLLDAFGVKDKDDEIPYKKISDIEQVKESVADDEDCIHVRILIPQTTDCSKYSNAKNVQSKETKKSQKKKETDLEQEYMQNFNFALQKFQPNIVICENVSTLGTSGIQFLSKLYATLRSAGMTVQETIINHSDATATRRKRHYTIGCDFDFNFNLNHIFVPRKDRIPYKYLLHANPTAESKYGKIKKEENVAEVIEKVRGQKVIKDNSAFAVNHIQDLIKMIKLHILFNKEFSNSHKHLIILPKKIKQLFPKKNGNQRKNKKLAAGLIVTLTEKNGDISFDLCPANSTKKPMRFSNLNLLYSKSPTPTLVGNNTFYFWDLEGYHPSMGELALIQGMTKSYTEKLVDYNNKIGPANGQKVLAHNLSPKIVSPILVNLIEQKIFNKKMMATNTVSLTKDESEITHETIFNDLKKDINLQNYKLLEVKLPDSDQSIYFIANQDGIVLDDGFIISDLPLYALHQNGFIKNGELTADYPHIDLPSDVETETENDTGIDATTSGTETENEIDIDATAPKTKPSKIEAPSEIITVPIARTIDSDKVDINSQHTHEIEITVIDAENLPKFYPQGMINPSQSTPNKSQTASPTATLFQPAKKRKVAHSSPPLAEKMTKVSDQPSKPNLHEPAWLRMFEQRQHQLSIDRYGNPLSTSDIGKILRK